jgi:hypothetical protein
MPQEEVEDNDRDAPPPVKVGKAAIKPSTGRQVVWVIHEPKGRDYEIIQELEAVNRERNRTEAPNKSGILGKSFRVPPELGDANSKTDNEQGKTVEEQEREQPCGIIQSPAGVGRASIPGQNDPRAKIPQAQQHRRE